MSKLSAYFTAHRKSLMGARTAIFDVTVREDSETITDLPCAVRSIRLMHRVLDELVCAFGPRTLSLRYLYPRMFNCPFPGDFPCSGCKTSFELAVVFPVDQD